MKPISYINKSTSGKSELQRTPHNDVSFCLPTNFSSHNLFSQTTKLYKFEKQSALT